MSIVDKVERALDWVVDHILATAPYLGMSVVGDAMLTMKAIRADAVPAWVVLKAVLNVAATIYFLRIYMAKPMRGRREPASLMSLPSSTTTIVRGLDR